MHEFISWLASVILRSCKADCEHTLCVCWMERAKTRSVLCGSLLSQASTELSVGETAALDLFSLKVSRLMTHDLETQTHVHKSEWSQYI